MTEVNLGAVWKQGLGDHEYRKIFQKSKVQMRIKWIQRGRGIGIKGGFS